MVNGRKMLDETADELSTTLTAFDEEDDVVALHARPASARCAARSTASALLQLVDVGAAVGRLAAFQKAGFDHRMATLLDLPAGLYRGRVSGPESGSCEARIEVRRVPGGCVAVDYEAVGIEGVQHVEHTIIAPATLTVAHSEATGVHIFTEVSPGVYESALAGPYVQRLMLGWDGTVLTWAWHWAPGGEEPQEQSRAVVQLAGG